MIGWETASGVDAAARATAAALSRRESLLALGGAALAAVAGSAPAKAGNGGKSAKKAAKQKCRRQGGQCRSSLLTICAGIGVDCDPFLPCCDSFARCDAAGAVTCIFGQETAAERRAGRVGLGLTAR